MVLIAAIILIRLLTSGIGAMVDWAILHAQFPYARESNAMLLQL